MIAGRTLAALVFALLVPVLGLASSGGAMAGEERVITRIEPTASKAGLSIRFTLTGKTGVRTFAMKNPDRIAVDFDNTVPAVAFDQLPDNALASTVRHGLVTADRYRVIFRLKAPAAALVSERVEDGRQVVDVALTAPGGSLDGVGQVASAAAEPSAPRSGDGLPARAAGPRKLTIVIDPGHGGDDKGAVSPSGTMEKNVNLENARLLRDLLRAYPNVDAELTRNSDVFIPLDARAASARELGADLFLSIHADSIHYKALRGATVYTLSEDASDELSRQIAANENASDRFAPKGFQETSPEIFDILLDLTRRETVSFSEHFASALVADLSKRNIELIKNPKRSAGFRVLKAPDIPSVLVEMGFLSNDKDEKLLKDDAWRRKITSAIAESIIGFFRGGQADALKAAERRG